MKKINTLEAISNEESLDMHARVVTSKVVRR